jgi:hypothetical protein
MGKMIGVEGADEPLCVTIEAAPPIGYDRQLNCQYWGVTSDERYAVEFRARADGPRMIS